LIAASEIKAPLETTVSLFDGTNLTLNIIAGNLFYSQSIKAFFCMRRELSYPSGYDIFVRPVPFITLILSVPGSI
jgi:hypothetical protein